MQATQPGQCGQIPRGIDSLPSGGIKKQHGQEERNMLSVCFLVSVLEIVFCLLDRTLLRSNALSSVSIVGPRQPGAVMNIIVLDVVYVFACGDWFCYRTMFFICIDMACLLPVFFWFYK